MYEQFFGLRDAPFELDANLRFLYLPEPHKEALANLQYAISSRKPVTLLTGEVGSGKTTVVRAAIASQPAGASWCVHVTNPRLTRTELFETLERAFQLPRGVGESKVTCLDHLERLLLLRLRDAQYTALIVDEAQTLSTDVVEEIRLLTNMEHSGERLLSVILVGQPEFAARLDDPEMRHLKQRIALRCSLRPLTLPETAAYIARRIEVAGGRAAGVFTREAVQAIYEASGGIPRLISVLSDNSLVTGFAVNVRPVTSSLVREVCRDFHVSEPASDLIETPALAAPPKVESEPGAAPPVPAGPERATPEAIAEREPLFASVGRPRRFGWF